MEQSRTPGQTIVVWIQEIASAITHTSTGSPSTNNCTRLGNSSTSFPPTSMGKPSASPPHWDRLTLNQSTNCMGKPSTQLQYWYRKSLHETQFWQGFSCSYISAQLKTIPTTEVYPPRQRPGTGFSLYTILYSPCLPSLQSSQYKHNEQQQLWPNLSITSTGPAHEPAASTVRSINSGQISP